LELEYKKFVRAWTLIAAGRHPQDVVDQLNNSGTHSSNDSPANNITVYDLVTHMARMQAHSWDVSDETIAHERMTMYMVPVKTKDGVHMLRKDEDGWFRLMKKVDIMAERCGTAVTEVEGDTMSVGKNGHIADPKGERYIPPPTNAAQSTSQTGHGQQDIESPNTSGASVPEGSEKEGPHHLEETLTQTPSPRQPDALLGSGHNVLSVEEVEEDDGAEVVATEAHGCQEIPDAAAPKKNKNKRRRNKRKRSHKPQSGIEAGSCAALAQWGSLWQLPDLADHEDTAPSGINLGTYLQFLIHFYLLALAVCCAGLFLMN
jgi:hypothetical protein